MNSPIVTEVIEEMSNLPDDLQQEVLKFVVNLRQRHIQTTGHAWDVLESLTGTIEAPPDWSTEHESSPIPISAAHPSVGLKESSFDPDAPPIWELVAEISAQIPDEEWQKLPTDLARRFDRYQRQRQGKD